MSQLSLAAAGDAVVQIVPYTANLSDADLINTYCRVMSDDTAQVLDDLDVVELPHLLEQEVAKMALATPREGLNKVHRSGPWCVEG